MKRVRGYSLDASSCAALAWPFISATCEDEGGDPYRQLYADWCDQGLLKGPGLELLLLALVCIGEAKTERL